jgi:pilus assembly protein CpaC
MLRQSARQLGNPLPTPGPVGVPLGTPAAGNAPVITPAPGNVMNLPGALPGTPIPTLELPASLPLPITPNPVITPESGKFVKQAKEPDNTLEIIVGRLQVFHLAQPPKRIQIGDESIAGYALLSPTELSLQGLRVGATVLNLWFNDVTEVKPRLISFLVRVLPDPDARHRLERAYKNLENEINKAFPNSRVGLHLIGDKLMVTGLAHDTAEANMIMRLVQANVLPEVNDSPDLARPATADPINQVNRILPAVHRSVVNMLRVPGEQQVMLSVQVVEVNRAAARSIGLNFGLLINDSSFIGATTGNLFQTGLNGGLGTFASFTANPLGFTGLGGLPNIPMAFDNGQIQVALTALRSHGYSRYLAEPNLTAIHGQTANFQAGGLLPVPTITGGIGFGNLQGVNFVPTGVQLAFTPFITDRDRIRLNINAEISDRDQAAGVTLIDGAAVPSLVTRNFTTTVEMREGQTLAVAGLIENRLDAQANRIPFWESIPLLGRLGAYDRINAREKELVILITPRLVHPMECKDIPPLPGHDILEPNDFEFYVLGRTESHTGTDYRSPIRTDFGRRQQYRAMERNMLIGPSGPSCELPDLNPGTPAGSSNGGVPQYGQEIPVSHVPSGVIPAKAHGAEMVRPSYDPNRLTHEPRLPQIGENR